MIEFKINYKGQDKERKDYFYVMSDGGVMRSNGHVITREVDLYYRLNHGEWVKVKSNENNQD
jgi:hypothetical protein